MIYEDEGVRAHIAMHEQERADKARQRIFIAFAVFTFICGVICGIAVGTMLG